MQINPQQLSVNQLFGSPIEQYVIPAYQRRYSWHERQVWELIDDIGLIDGIDKHLLGSIVCLVDHHSPGLNKLELVDGQQRMTTISILLECIGQQFTAIGKNEEAAEVMRLLHAKPLGGQQVRKISLDSIDKAEFDRLVANDTTHEYRNKHLVWTFLLCEIGLQLKNLIPSFFYVSPHNQAIVIRIDVSDAKDAFKLLKPSITADCRLSPTDIIRIFCWVMLLDLVAMALQTARDGWTQLIQISRRRQPQMLFSATT